MYQALPVEQVGSNARSTVLLSSLTNAQALCSTLALRPDTIALTPSFAVMGKHLLLTYWWYLCPGTLLFPKLNFELNWRLLLASVQYLTRELRLLFRVPVK